MSNVNPIPALENNDNFFLNYFQKAAESNLKEGNWEIVLVKKPRNYNILKFAFCHSNRFTTSWRWQLDPWEFCKTFKTLFSSYSNDLNTVCTISRYRQQPSCDVLQVWGIDCRSNKTSRIWKYWVDFRMELTFRLE